MGSSGSGSFSDYSGSTAPKSGPGAGGGGTSGVDRCQQAFSTVLEEVAQCDYFTQSRTVPGVDQPLTLVFATRVFAVDQRGIKVGALPTAYNYLASCLKAGLSYTGVVRSSALTPMPTVEADFVPQ
ncbi:hypothetical protein CUPL110328_15795 [Cupriavidus plantarum]|nr:hypothetical protein LMG26296_01469 [Cupriavidus plantarum]SMR66397.1 hypothetical protein SAMN05421735_1280 [Cupriavidus plantarum]